MSLGCTDVTAVNGYRHDCVASAVTAEEKMCPIALDYDTELKPAAESPGMEITYELPDGNITTVDDGRVRCPEVLSKPPFIGM